MALLRARTAAAHTRLESRLDVLSPDLTVARYTAILRGMYSLHSVIEPCLDRILDRPFTVLPDWPARRKTPALVGDLSVLGVAGAGLAGIPPARVPPVRGERDAFGVLYVVEGATLGGRLIARHLTAAGVVPASALTFFGAYGDEIGRRWSRLRRALRGWVGADAARAEAVVASARGTFAAFERVFTTAVVE